LLEEARKLPTNGVLLNKKALTHFCLLMLLTPLLSFPLVGFASANFELYQLVPKVSVSVPAMNGVYNESTIYMNVKVETNSHFFTGWEKVTWMQYRLDGQPGVNLPFNTQGSNPGYVATVTKAITDLSDGVHSLSIYGQTDLTNYSSGKPLSNFSVTNYFIVGNSTPMIQVLSPKPITYDSTSIPLEFKSDTPLSWAGFSLDDNQVSTSLTNRSLNSLLDGRHTLRMYGNDSTGHLYTSEAVDFIVKDHDAPVIRIDADAIAKGARILPHQKDFNWTILQIVFEVNEPTSWIGYSLDGNSNKTIYENYTITHLFYGSHTIIVYAKDNSGNIGTSEVYSFNLTDQGISAATLTPNESTGNSSPSTLFIAVVAAAVVVTCVGSTVYIKKHRRQSQ
jgi:hypothetical protein